MKLPMDVPPPVAADVSPRCSRTQPPHEGSADVASAGPGKCPFLGLAAVLLLFVAGAGTTQASGTITNCTYEKLVAAMVGGGAVRFATNGTMSFGAPLLITRDTSIDASTNAINASTNTVTLSGGGTNAGPFFIVCPGVQLELKGLILSARQSTNGGAIIHYGRMLRATHCVFTDTTAAGPSGDDGTTGADGYGTGKSGTSGGSGLAAKGGAIYGEGDMELTACTFDENQAQGGSGGNGGDGGDGEIRGGNGGDGGGAGAGYGGAIYVTAAGSLTLTDCIFTNNVALGGTGGEGGEQGSGMADGYSGQGAAGSGGYGGALYVEGIATLERCSFSANSAEGGDGQAGRSADNDNGANGRPGGPALGAALFASGSSLRVVNCTFYANTATGGAAGDGGAGFMIGGEGGQGGDALGGALYLGTPSELIYCTFFANDCSGGANGVGGTGIRTGDDGDPGQALGAHITADATATLKNVLFAEGTGTTLFSGSFTDSGGNLSADSTPGFTHATSQNQVDLEFGTLALNHGLTPSLPLPPGSPAIGHAVADTEVTADQRGVSRPQGMAADSGAFERKEVGISGFVYVGTNGVAGVSILLVSITDATTHETVTASDGSFSFSPVDPGIYEVKLGDAWKDAYDPSSQGLYVSDTSEGFTDVDFYSNTSAQLALTLTYVRTNGTLVLVGSGLPVCSYRLQGTSHFLSSSTAWSNLGARTSDAAGRFEFSDTNSVVRRFYRAVQQ